MRASFNLYEYVNNRPTLGLPHVALSLEIAVYRSLTLARTPCVTSLRGLKDPGAG